MSQFTKIHDKPESIEVNDSVVSESTLETEHLDDESGSKSPTSDFYVRLYDEDDKDYCFVVKINGMLSNVLILTDKF